MTGAGSTELLSLLAARHRRAQTEHDDLRQRGLEMVIAACVTDFHNSRQRSPDTVPIDTSALSEADVTSRAQPSPEAAETSEPETKEEVPLPTEPDESDGGWEWPVPDDPPTLEDDLVILDPSPSQPEDEPETPERPPPRTLDAPVPAPPVSPEPAVEDVRGAWKPPQDG